MSRDTWKILKQMSMEESINQVEVELAMQCAPLITGMKISNLFSIGLDDYKAMYDILENSGISVYQIGTFGRQSAFSAISGKSAYKLFEPERRSRASYQIRL